MPAAREGRAREGGLPLSLEGLPRENFEFLALLCAFLMGFNAFGTRFQSRFFARKDISWRVRKPNAKQNRFQIVTIFCYFFLQHISKTLCHLCSRRFWQITLSTDPWLSWADPEGGQGVRTPLKNHKKLGFLKQYWSRSHEKSQSYQASIQCLAIIGPPASGITFWIRAWLYFKE